MIIIIKEKRKKGKKKKNRLLPLPVSKINIIQSNKIYVLVELTEFATIDGGIVVVAVVIAVQKFLKYQSNEIRTISTETQLHSSRQTAANED